MVQAGKYTGDKIQSAPFIGVSPVRFRDLYERQRRKDDNGNFREWAEGHPRPIVKYTVATYLENEKALIKIFVDATKKLGDAGAVTYAP